MKKKMEMIWTIIVTHWKLIAGVGTAIGTAVAWASNARKRKNEDLGSEIENIKNIVSIFGELKEMETYFKGRILTLQEHIASVEAINSKLDGMVTEQKILIKKQQRIINSQTKTLNKYKEKFGELTN